MIARKWHGTTSPEHFEAYSEFMQERAIPDYQSIEGFVRLDFLRRLDQNSAHFELITYWKDLDSIKKFAGDDYHRAKYYPEDSKFLLEFEPNVTHFDLFATYEAVS